MKKKLTQSITSSSGVIAAYLWYTVPELQPFALQAFAGSFFIYFLIKKAEIKQAKKVETGVLTFSFLLLTTSTGLLESMLFPLIYILLFLLVFREKMIAAIVTTVLIVLHFILLSMELHSHNIATLTSIPLLFIFFAFAKQQYDQVSLDKRIISLEKKAINDTSENVHALITFDKKFLKPHIKALKEYINNPDRDMKTITSQLSILEVEIDKISEKHTANQLEIEEKITSIK